MESIQGFLTLHMVLARIYGCGKSAVISYSELQQEAKFSYYVDEKIHPYSSMLFSWIAPEQYDKSKWVQKNGGETVA